MHGNFYNAVNPCKEVKLLKIKNQIFSLWNYHVSIDLRRATKIPSYWRSASSAWLINIYLGKKVTYAKPTATIYKHALVFVPGGNQKLGAFAGMQIWAANLIKCINH